MAKSISLTKGKTTLIDDEDFEWLNKIKWCFNNGYAVTHYGPSLNRKRFYMHRLIMKPPIGKEVDHINGDKLDNRKENLRICSHSENSRNQGLTSKNNSGYKGVSYNKRENKWQAALETQNKSVFIGYYNNPEDAAMAYDKKACEIFGEFARTNFNTSYVP